MDFEGYVYKNGRMLRRGYTTGTCAAAAAKAAAAALIMGKMPASVDILTPSGVEITLDIADTAISGSGVSAAVRKDGGDDPDVTDGLLIYALAEKIPSGIEICGGEGVGTVTKDGLDQPVGAAAINSVPRQMITAAVNEICAANGYGGGVRITVYVPDGVKIARKTYNPRMGIKGGISIIGTTGIVEPMSDTAIVGTMRAELKTRRAAGHKYAAFTIGNYGKAFAAENMPFNAENCVTCSNFIGEAVDAAAELGFHGALFIGHIGKLVKLGAGIMNTHSSQGDARMEVLVSCALKAEADIKTLLKISGCVSTDAAAAVLADAGILGKTTDILAERAQYYLDARSKGAVKAGAVMFSDKLGITVKTSAADELIQRISEEENG